MFDTEADASAECLITHVRHYSVRENDDGSRDALYYLWPVVATKVFFFFRNDLPGKLNVGSRCEGGCYSRSAGDEQGGVRCQGGRPVTHQTSELMSSQIHSYLNWPLLHHIGGKDIYMSATCVGAATFNHFFIILRQINTAILPLKTAAVFTTAILKSFTVIKKILLQFSIKHSLPHNLLWYFPCNKKSGSAKCPQ